MSKTIEEKLGVNLNDAATEAHALFFKYMQEFEKMAKTGAVSKKDLIRAMKGGFFNGLIDAEVKLRSDQEQTLSHIINELIKCSIVMHAKLIKDNETNDASELSEDQLNSALGIGREGV